MQFVKVDSPAGGRFTEPARGKAIHKLISCNAMKTLWVSIPSGSTIMHTSAVIGFYISMEWAPQHLLWLSNAHCWDNLDVTGRFLMVFLQDS